MLISKTMQQDCLCLAFIFFFNDTATTEIYTLSLHDALPISADPVWLWRRERILSRQRHFSRRPTHLLRLRSEEHTSELQSRRDLVCRLLLEKKKNNTNQTFITNNKNNQQF